MLAGLKTYITAALAAAVAILAYLTGQISIFEAATAVGLATGFWGTRSVMHAIEILAIVKDPSRMALTPDVRQYLTYAGAGVAILSAVMGLWSGQTDLPATLATVLTALGINFLSVGAKSTANEMVRPVGS
jgi:hypothetical protein